MRDFYIYLKKRDRFLKVNDETKKNCVEKSIEL